MRTISFILAFAFVLAGPSMAGCPDQGLPGIGTFAYQRLAGYGRGFQPIVVAAN